MLSIIYPNLVSPNRFSERHAPFAGYYKQRGLGVNSKDVKEGQAVGREPSMTKKREWFKRMVAKSPTVFHEWFRDSFTTPHNWHQARSSYIRTTAVMSMVGYILGLGDRHGENILLDATNGDLVHVDFNCLFNKGELFEIPEVVPFRLTHNMVHAFGPLGVEGLYRKCCEITLKVLQEQTATLMSVLRPLVYDPLLSWSRQVQKSDGQLERTDPAALTNVRHIENRLKGLVCASSIDRCMVLQCISSTLHAAPIVLSFFWSLQIKIDGNISKMSLSAEGVVNHCTIEAMDTDRLARMYVGWGAYL